MPGEHLQNQPDLFRRLLIPLPLPLFVFVRLSHLQPNLEELKGLVANAKADANQFIRRQGMKMERYLNQLAAGEITQEEFESDMEDLRALTEMQSLKMKVAAKASAQRFCKGIEDVVLNGLLELL